MKSNKKIIILASAINNHTGGAFVVLTQFMQALCLVDSDTEIVLISPATIPDIDHSRFKQIRLNHNRQWIKRIFYELFFWSSSQNHADIILSFQNTMPLVFGKKERWLYLHQPLPFTKKIKINPFRKDQRSDFIKRHFYLWMIKIGLRKDTKIVVQTEWMRQSVIQKLSHPIDMVIKATPSYAFDYDKYAAKRQRNKNNLLFYPAYFHFHKNHITLIQGLAIAVKSNPILKLALSLNGTEDGLKELAISLGVEKQIVWLGALTKEQVFDYYQQSDCLIFPSILETLGLPLLEAAHFNLPILASDLPYAREVLFSYKNTTYFNPFDPKSIAQAILESPEKPFYTDEFKSSGVSWHDFANKILGS